MLVTLSGIITLVSPVQRAKAYSPMLVTLLPIVTLESPVQPKNASSPMLVTLSGIVMLVRKTQFLNCETPILVVPYGTIYEVFHFAVYVLFSVLRNYRSAERQCNRTNSNDF